MPIAYTDYSPEATRIGYKTTFFKFLDTSPASVYNGAATIENSLNDQETYTTFGNVGGMEIIEDERKIRGMGPKAKYTIVNKLWGATIKVDRTLIEDEKYGEIKRKIQGMAQGQQRLFNKYTFKLLHDGAEATSLCYDGQPFFSDTHSIGSSGNQDNNYAQALDKTSLETVITAMRNFKDDQGESLEMEPDTLIVNPSLAFTAAELLNATTIVVSGETDKILPAYNGLKGLLPNLIVTPQLTSGTEWYIACTTRGVKPILIQNRTQQEFDGIIDPNSEYVVKHDAQLWWTRWRGNFGYADPLTCIRGNT